MAVITPKQSAQSLDARLIELVAGEVATIKLVPDKIGGPAGPVNWDGGGVSWSVVPKTSGDAIDVSVDYSLYQAGDEDWVPHVSSPFTEAKQENECGRCDRIRFTIAAGSNPVYATVASNSKFTVETA